MSNTEWSAVLHQIDEMMGGGTAGASTIWKAYEDGVSEDLTIVELAEGIPWTGRQLTNGDEIREWIKTTKAQASTAAVAFGDIWRDKIRPDVAMMNLLDGIADAWTDDVANPVRNEPSGVRDSSLLQSWSGPGAQAYATAVMTQAAAMEEMNGLANGAGTQMKNTANLVKGMALLFLHSIQPVHDKLAGWPKHGYGDEHNEDMIFGERTGYGKAQFEGLRTWAETLLSGGDWKDQALDIKTGFEDLKAKTQAFKTNTWPKATTGIDGDMHNGNSGLGDQANQPGSTPGTTAPTTGQPSSEPDPDAPGGTTVNDKGGYEGGSGGGQSPTGDDQYGGSDYGGKDYDNDTTTQGAGTEYSNVDDDD